jgi:predicted transcriptional regulator
MAGGGKAMEITFTPEEHELIAEILEEHHRELLREIARTEHREFKVVLRHREEMVQGVLNKLAKYASAA